MAEQTRILLADDHAALREALRALIGLERDLLVVGEAGSGEEAISEVAALRPDVLVIDINMPGIGGIEAIHQITGVAPRVAVVVLTAEPEAEHLRPALEAGARGYVAKTVADMEIVPAIRTVARGGWYLPARVERVLGRA